MMQDNKEKNAVIVILIFLTLGLYFLEGVLFNPMILWTALPVFIGYLIFKIGWEKHSRKKLIEAYTFLVASMAFSYWYHFAWFFDWGKMQTGGSTSALIFVWFPIYATIIGFIGYFFGSFAEDKNV